MPSAWLPPQLATLTDSAPAGDDWIHEIKYDGYRLLAWLDARSKGKKARVRLLTRNRKDWTDRFDGVASALEALDLADTVLDGEVAVELAGGETSFQALQNALREPERGSLQYFIFDVLRVRGRDVTSLPQLERKELVRDLLAGAGPPLRYSDHVVGQGQAFHAQACELGLEGIISKRASAPYRGGRGSDWLKVKCVRDQEFVVGGFTEPAGSRAGLGALHMGAWDGDRLVYRGKVGTGFTDAVLLDLRRRLNRLERPDSPFDGGPRGAAARAAHWVEPELVAQIRFTDITDDGLLRHPSFRGLREDKAAADVVVESEHRTSDVVAQKGRRNVAGRTKGGKKGGTKAGDATVDVAGERLTSPDRVLYPDQGLTKLDLARHYERVAELMLPHISGRPLTLVRCPAGRQAHCFFQKHMDESAPAAVRRVQVEERDGPEWYGTVDSLAGLVSLVQLGTLEFHTSNARADRLERPDRFLIDLDPDEDLGWSDVVTAAFEARDLLAEIGLVSFVKTTGGKGLHVVVPLVRRAGWDEVKAFSRAVAALLADAAPDRYTIELAKKKRHGRILLDYLRNTEGATAVEAWSTRARPGAPVAVPIEWDELHDGVRADSFTVENLPGRLASLRADPWREIGTVRQSLTVPMKRKVGL